jgi:hypothetical protein
MAKRGSKLFFASYGYRAFPACCVRMAKRGSKLFFASYGYRAFPACCVHTNSIILSYLETWIVKKRVI